MEAGGSTTLKQEAVDAFQRAINILEIGQELSGTTLALKEEEHELICQ